MNGDAPTLFDEVAPGSFHVGDPWTSKAAARKVALIVGRTRYRVLDALAGAVTGLTDYELGGLLEILPTTAGTRRGELEAAGYVEPAGIRRPTDTGALAQAHRITLAGRQALTAARETGKTATMRPPGPLSAAKPPGRTIARTQSRYGLTTARDRVLEELVAAGAAGLTDDQLATAVGMLRTAAGTARKALVELELAVPVRRDGQVVTRRNAAGNRATVHRVTIAGITELVAAIERHHPGRAEAILRAARHPAGGAA